MKHTHSLTTMLALSVFLFFGYAFAQSQIVIPSDNQTKFKRCGTADADEYRLAHDSIYKIQRKQMNDYLNQWIIDHPDYSPKTSYIIPVVVHIIYKTAAENLGTSRVTDQIAATNADWAGINAHSMHSFASSLKANTNVQFCLATVDPSGYATTGITYTQTTVTSFNITGSSASCSGYPERCTSTGGCAAWDVTKYFNIWVCNCGSSLCGISEFPTSPLNVYYGSTINYQFFGTTGSTSPYDLGGTLSHEAGHCFNLYHTWGDQSGCSTDDNVTDTPLQDVATTNLPTTTVTDQCTTSSPGILWEDFMDYTYDAGYACFTPGQVTRIQAAVSTYLTSVANNAATACSTGAVPVADFTADVTTSCTGVIHFTDASTNTPTSWAWTFGDGGTSTSQNPSHTYTASGTYTVSLTATNSHGNNTKTRTSYITISLPTVPITTNDTICGSGTALLNASGSGTLTWYDASTGGNIVNTGTSFTTPTISTTTTYYVENDILPSPVYVGKADNSGGGGYVTGTTSYLIFDCYTPVTLVTVDMYFSGAGNRTVELRNSSGTILQSTIVSLGSTSPQTVTLNLSIPVGTSLQLGATGTTINLYRNNSGVTYPYTASGLLSITGASTSGRYYYFYNWKIQEPGCSSSRTPVTAVVTSGPAASVSISANPSGAICSGTSVTFTATATNGGSSPTYQWKNNSSNISGATNSTYTSSTLANGNVITCVMTSNASCVTGSPATSNSITMTVNAGGAASVSITQSPIGSICAGTSVTYTATPTNGGTPTYQWKLNGTNITGATNSTFTSTTLVNSDVITCVMSSSLTCATGSPATSNSITITVYPSVPVTITIAANPSGGVCAGTSVVFSATPTNGGTTPTYQWKKNGTNISGATTTTYTSSTLANNDVITCILTSSVTCASPVPATSNSITMSVNSSQPASVSIVAVPNGTICSGTSVTFTATATNGGTPTYQWKNNGSSITGATNSTYTSSTLANNDIITCVMTSGLTCATGSPATSNSITITVNSTVVASVSIAASPSGAICSGTSVTFTATPTNGGSPLYQWKKNGSNISGATNSTYTSPTLANNDIITCVMTSSLTCATGSPAPSNSITMTVNSPVAASVSISANPSGAICSGTSIAFTASATNGGTPAYQWQLNGSNVLGETNSTYSSSTLSNGDAITCIMISSVTCATGSPATSNTITMIVNSNTTADVSIAASPSGSICSGTSVIFTSTPTNGGTNPAFQWQLNGTDISGATASVYTTTSLVNGDIITCVMASNANCVSGSPAYSNPIVMTVSSSPVASVSIAALPSLSICTGDNVIFTATGINGGTPSYQWQLNGNNVGTNSSTYSSTSFSDGDIVTCIMTSSLVCSSGSPATSNSLTISVNTSITLDISISAVPSGSICSGTLVTFTASSQNPSSSPTYQWQVNGVNVGTNSTTFSSSILSDGDIVTCTLISASNCAINNPAYSNPITMLISSSLFPGITIAATTPVSVCQGESVSFTATPTNEGTSPVYQWQINSSNVGTNSSAYTYNSFSDGDVVTCMLTSSLSCATGNPATSNAVTITVFPTPPTPVITQVGDTLFSSYGTGNQWYFSNSLGGFAISGATGNSYVPIISGDYYVIVMDSNGCISDTSNAISILIGGINEIESSLVELYPNPNNGTFDINYHGLSNDDAEVLLVNSLGQVLLSRNIKNNTVSKFNASHLSSGMYFLKLTTNNNTYLYKVLIAK